MEYLNNIDILKAVVANNENNPDYNQRVLRMIKRELAARISAEEEFRARDMRNFQAAASKKRSVSSYLPTSYIISYAINGESVAEVNDHIHHLKKMIDFLKSIKHRDTKDWEEDLLYITEIADAYSKLGDIEKAYRSIVDKSSFQWG